MGPLSFAAAGLADHRDLVERRVLARTAAEQLRARPAPHLNSLVFILWHVARVEDVALNVVLAGRAEVRMSGGWAARLQLDEPRVGTAFTSSEVDELGRAASAAGVVDSWRAVRAATLDWLGGAPAGGDGVPAARGLAERLDGLFPRIAPGAPWLQQFWRGRPPDFFLRMPVVNHGFMHYGEMMTIQSALGIEGR